MTDTPISPIRPTDDAARALGRLLLMDARHGALGVLLPETGAPMVTRVAVICDNGQPVTLISSLSAHTRALHQNPACSLLVGDPGTRGDPLTHPRLTLQCTARFVARSSDEHRSLRALYLTQQPKAKLYIDFKDFALVRLAVDRAYLNGGFGKAFHLTAQDLLPPETGRS